MRIEPAFLFDLDGTLVDSVYQHVLAWKKALDSEGIDLSVWRIHRKIGMSGGLFTNQLERETGVEMSEDRLERLRQKHVEAYRRMSDHIRPLPGARELLAWLSNAGLQWAIATSGRMETAAVNLQALGVDPAKTPVVTRSEISSEQISSRRADRNSQIEYAQNASANVLTKQIRDECRSNGNEGRLAHSYQRVADQQFRVIVRHRREQGKPAPENRAQEDDQFARVTIGQRPHERRRNHVETQEGTGQESNLSETKMKIFLNQLLHGKQHAAIRVIQQIQRRQYEKCTVRLEILPGHRSSEYITRTLLSRC